jgi:tetrahydromethanopterin S-methyltransferase subunit F
VSVRSSEERQGSTDAIAGFLAAIALVAGLFSIVYRPARIGPAALVIALVAVAMGGRNERLATWAVAAVTVGWVIGMIVAVLTENPLY